MSRQQQHALFNLLICLTAVAAFSVMLPKFGFARAQAAFAVTGFLAFGQFFYRRKFPGQVLTDERDDTIRIIAGTIAFSVFWLVFVAMCMVPWWIYRDRGTISVDVLPAMVEIGLLVFVIVHAVVTLVQCRGLRHP